MALNLGDNASGIEADLAEQLVGVAVRQLSIRQAHNPHSGWRFGVGKLHGDH